MKTYRLTYPDGTEKIAIVKNALELVKKFDLATRESQKVIIWEVEDEKGGTL